jgi:hypothetical protein
LDSQAYFLLTKALIQQIDCAHQGSVAGIAVIKQRNLIDVLKFNTLSLVGIGMKIKHMIIIIGLMLVYLIVDWCRINI